MLARNLIGILAAVLITHMPVPPAKAQVASPNRAERVVERHSCATATSRCEGKIRVPLDWSDRDSELIDVAFVWLPRTDTTRPAIGTILANFGGPAAAISYAPRFQRILGPVLERRNLLLVDVRGCPVPLRPRRPARGAARQLDRFLLTERPLNPFVPGDFADVIGLVEPCVHWPTPRASPPAPPDADYPSVPVFAVSGDFDTWRPAEVAKLNHRFPESTLLHVRYGSHALAAGAHPHHECVRKVARAFLEAPRHPAPVPAEPGGCDAENFRAVGSFPREGAALPAAEAADLSDQDRRLVAAAFATATDAVARRSPQDAFGRMRPKTEPGLRGGEVRWDPETRTIALDQVRFVGDLAVTGTVRLGLDLDYRATAELKADVPEAGPAGSSSGGSRSSRRTARRSLAASTDAVHSQGPGTLTVGNSREAHFRSPPPEISR
jgi:hypothetical protein